MYQLKTKLELNREFQCTFTILHVSLQMLI